MPATASKFMLISLLAAALATRAAAEALRLSMPIACELGRNCFVQHYVDIEPSDGIRDHTCGDATYDAHKGTDFRLVSAKASGDSVRVLAAAPGVVKGVRDGMPDGFSWAIGRTATAGRECGNGVTLEHGNGWETQYCHLREGSLRVRVGQTVERGEHIGNVGFSGLADFVHLHFEVRRKGKFVDPFLGTDPEARCGDDTRSAALWNDEFLRAYQYRSSEFIGSGFASVPPDWKQMEIGGDVRQLAANSSAVIFYVRLINLRRGDRVRMRVSGPDGFNLLTTTEPLDRKKPVWIAYAGRRLAAAVWPVGTYTGTAELLRGEAVVATASAETLIDK